MSLYVTHAIANTPTAPINYEVCFNKILAKDCLPLEKKEVFAQLCSSGCINFGRKWSCPPLSPSYSTFCVNWKNLFVLYLETNTKQFWYIKNDYLKIKAANSILKSRAEKFLRTVASKHGNYISSGSCRLCKLCNCKKGLSCSHPNRMSYSFEALGIDVDALISMCFKVHLIWYTPKNLPEHTAVVCGILTNNRLSIEYLIDEYKRIITR